MILVKNSNVNVAMSIGLVLIFANKSSKSKVGDFSQGLP